MGQFCPCYCLGLLLAVGLLGCPGSMTPAAPPGMDAADAPAAFTGSKAGDAREVGSIQLCWCPPGRFRMGSPPDEPERNPDEAPVEVTLTKGFWMGKYGKRPVNRVVSGELRINEPTKR